MAKPHQTEEDVPSLRSLFRRPKSKSARVPSLTRGVAILSLRIAIFLFIAFVPSRPGASRSNKPILFAIALYWTGRSIEEIIAARVSKRHHAGKRSNQSLQPTAGRRDAQI